MFFRICAVAAAIAASGCGALGKKEELQSTPHLGKPCLNDLGTRISRYLDGAEDPEQWRETWDCAIGAVRTFQKYVGRAGGRDYSVEDMRGFIARFLVGDRPVGAGLVAAAFELKAALLGGSPDRLTSAEIDQGVELLLIVNTETTRMLHVLAGLRGKKTVPGLTALRDGIAEGGLALANALPAGPRRAMRLSAVVTLITELFALVEAPVPGRLGAYLGVLKALLVGGGTEEVRPQEWPRMVEVTARIGGSAAGILAADPDELSRGNEYFEFLLSMGGHIRATFERSLAWNGGVFDYASLDRLVDSIPRDWLPFSAAAVKASVRPVSSKILGSRNPRGVDAEAIGRLHSLALDWVRGNTHLQNVFDRLARLAGEPGLASVHPEEFVRECQAYAEGLSDGEREAVRRIAELAVRYRPLFEEGDDRISFNNSMRLSRNHMAKIHVIQLLGGTVLRAYTDAPAHLATLGDLKAVAADFRALADELSLLDPARPDQEPMRFNEMNLFTFASNGDAHVDLDELTYYVAYVVSIKGLAAEIQQYMRKESGCAVGTDGSVEARCYRRAYFGNSSRFWSFMPAMVDHYERLGAEGRARMAYDMERRARERYEDAPFTRFDSERMAAVLHYMESLMARFDADRDEHLDKEETLAAFPSFRAFVRRVACLERRWDKRWVHEALFAYAVKYRTLPERNFCGKARLLAWAARRPVWRIHAARNALFELFADLARARYKEPCRRKPKGGQNEELW